MPRKREITFEELYSKYPGKWVAMSSDGTKVIAASRTPKGAVNKAQQSGEKNPVFTYVPRSKEVLIL